MTRAELRLEVLKICYRRDQIAETILSEAKKFEDYIEPQLNVREPVRAERTTGKTVPQTPGKRE